jgi:hypothetical protein
MKAVLLLMLVPVYCYCNSDASISNILVDQSTVELVLQSEPGKTYTLMTSPDLDVWEESDVFVTDSTNETIALARTTEPVEFYAFSESPTSPLIQGTLTELIALKRDDFTEGGVYNVRIKSNATIKVLGFNPADESVYFMAYGRGEYDQDNNATPYITEYYKVGADRVPILVGNQESSENSNYPPSNNFSDYKNVGRYYFSEDKLWYSSSNAITVIDFSDVTTHQTVNGPFLFQGIEYRNSARGYIAVDGEKLVIQVESESETLESLRTYFAVFDRDLSLVNVFSTPHYDEYGQRLYIPDYRKYYELVGDFLYVTGNLSFNFSEYDTSESGCVIRKMNINDGSFEDFIILDNPNDREVGTQLFKFNNNLLVYGHQHTYNSAANRDHSFFIKIDLNCVPIWSKFKNYELHWTQGYELLVEKQNHLTLFYAEGEWDRSTHFLHISDSGEISIQGTGLSSTFFPSNGGNIFGADNDSEPKIFMIDVAD